MTQESRRKVLKGLAVTIPAAWTTPVVESIVTPAHAGTSPFCSEDIEELCSDLELGSEEDCEECNRRFEDCGIDTVIDCQTGVIK